MEPGQPAQAHAREILAVGVFMDREAATRAVEQLIDDDFPMDRISVLGRAGGHGDDVLGLGYTDAGERVKAWGRQGAFWGALWGLLAGATGLFLLPGLGPLVAAGPVVEALGGAIAGAALAGAGMAGAAVVTELATALHRVGIPDEQIAELEQAIRDGHIVVILHCAPAAAEGCAGRLGWAGARDVRLLSLRY